MDDTQERGEATTRELFASGRAATQTWDGTNPITVYDLATTAS